MTYGRSIHRALDTFAIPHSSWATLAEDRAAWRGATHGELLGGGRPTRRATAATNRRIAATLADARAGIWDTVASATLLNARAAIAEEAMQ